MRNFYDFISYTASADGVAPGQGVIRVVGCNVQSEFDVPPGTAQDDPTWQDTVAAVISGVLQAVDPNSASYDSTLDNWANETE